MTHHHKPPSHIGLGAFRWRQVLDAWRIRGADHCGGMPSMAPGELDRDHTPNDSPLSNRIADGAADAHGSCAAVPLSKPLARRRAVAYAPGSMRTLSAMLLSL